MNLATSRSAEFESSILMRYRTSFKEFILLGNVFSCRHIDESMVHCMQQYSQNSSATVIRLVHSQYMRIPCTLLSTLMRKLVAFSMLTACLSSNVL